VTADEERLETFSRLERALPPRHRTKTADEIIRMPPAVNPPRYLAPAGDLIKSAERVGSTVAPCRTRRLTTFLGWTPRPHRGHRAVKAGWGGPWSRHNSLPSGSARTCQWIPAGNNKSGVVFRHIKQPQGYGGCDAVQKCGFT